MDAAVRFNSCRICMRSDTKIVLIGLFEHIVQTQSLAKVVSLVGAVEVEQNDELPKLCCTQCLQEVEAAYKLRTLCQESDVKLRGLLPDKAAIVKKERFSDDELCSQDTEGFSSSDEVLVQKEEEKMHSFEAVAVKDEPFSDDELNSQDLGSLASSDDVLAQYTPDASKHEFQEVKIEETRITDANYSESDQCSESKNSVSENVNYSNDQELEVNVSANKRLRIRRLPKIFEKYPAIKLSCCRCISVFDTIEELRAHGREEHCDVDLESIVLNKKQCDICFKVFRHRQSLEFHKRNVMYNCRCQVCDQIMITLKQALAHYQLKHTKRNPTADQVMMCCGCKMRFSSDEALRVHSETIHLPKKPPPDETKPVTCNICYRNYSCKRVLRRHKIGYLKQIVQCEECGKSFPSVSQLRQHEKFHTQRKTFSCSQCPKVYFHLSSFRRHLYYHSKPSDKYQCNECKRWFLGKALLTEHSQIHTGERPFSCQQCPATFKRKGHLTAHVITHDKRKARDPNVTVRLTTSGKTRHIQSRHD